MLNHMYQGLSTDQATALLHDIGENKIPEQRETLISKISKVLFSPISVMLILASTLSFATQKIFDGNFIFILLFLNVAITLWQENKADTAIAKLNAQLVQHVKVLRDQHWIQLNSTLLVPGDIVELTAGELVPVDGTILEAQHISVNEASLTGESLPKTKLVHEPVYSGSFLTTGLAIIQVTATGQNTSFGKTILSVDKVRKQSLLEKDILTISKFLTVFSLISVLVLTVVFVWQKASPLEILTLDLSLIIAGIPISLPTVMTLIIEFGVFSLAQRNVIVRRLSALQDLANVNFLLTDKTGTLTKNKITVQDIYAYDGFTHNSVLSLAFTVASLNDQDTINQAIIDKAKALSVPLIKFHKIAFIPADSARKHATLIFQHLADNHDLEIISLGAPQMIQQLCILDAPTHEKLQREVETLAQSGYRTLAVARKECDINQENSNSAESDLLRQTVHEEKNMQLVGLLALSDTIRNDSRSVIEFLKNNGIHVSMVTGDNQAIAVQVAKNLELQKGRVTTREELSGLLPEAFTKDFFLSAGSFAEILPEDKLNLVESAKHFFVVAANGDGINDLPAIKAANVGIAVKNAVTALKATADIVLLSDGISVICDAIIESRKIFERLYTYSQYRISESLRLIVTVVILGVLYHTYPLTPLQIILIALLNDIPIISLASDRVKIATRPSKIKVKERFVLSSLYGFTGVANSLILFFLVRNMLHLSWPLIQTIYFLKLTISGHMLIYVAHTKERWFNFLPSKEVILATVLTQLVASVLAFTGFLMPASLSLLWIVGIWIWALLWMQVSEGMKGIQKLFLR